jgi:hypothetical protein
MCTSSDETGTEVEARDDDISAATPCICVREGRSNDMEVARDNWSAIRGGLDSEGVTDDNKEGEACVAW